MVKKKLSYDFQSCAQADKDTADQFSPVHSHWRVGIEKKAVDYSVRNRLQTTNQKLVQ